MVDKSTIENKHEDQVRDVAGKVTFLLERDPLFGLYGVPDETGRYISDWNKIIKERYDK